VHLEALGKAALDATLQHGSQHLRLRPVKCGVAGARPYVKLLLRGALCLADVYGCVVDVVGQVSEGAHCGTGRYGAAQLGQVQGR
jgi:hypothetical protein